MASERVRFPLQGASNERVLEALERLRANDVPPHGTHNFRAVYYVDDQTLDLINLASTAYAEVNAVYGNTSFPSVKEIEQQLVGMGLDLLHAPAGAGGAVTTGGTESNFMVVKTARDYFRDRHPEREPFEIVVPHTAHASLEKAAHVLGIAVRRVRHSVEFAADPQAMEALVGAHTIMMVGSAPPAPYATTDPIAELSQIAERHGLWFHVDACMGGFFLPFARELGAPIPEFDFAVPGVWSVSADLHKFGYAPKGASLLLLRDAAMEEFRDFRFSDWPFGEFDTSGLAGSRPAAPVAAAWCVVNHLGRAGYLRITERLLALKQRLIDGVGRIDGLRVLGRPDAAHLFVAGDGVDIFAVEEELSGRGYALSRAYLPNSILLWINVTQEETMDGFLGELAGATAAVRKEGRQAKTRGTAYMR
jgi:glutamate/tyrosine decarboxylase-like PLP-dependent enzyme